MVPTSFHILHLCFNASSLRFRDAILSGRLNQNLRLAGVQDTVMNSKPDSYTSLYRFLLLDNNL